MFSNHPPKAPAPLTEAQLAESKRLKDEYMARRKVREQQGKLFMTEFKAMDPAGAAKYEAMVSQAETQLKAAQAVKVVLAGSKPR